MIIARSSTLVDDYEYISREDPAVDVDCEDFKQKWKLYLEGKGEPPLKPNAVPTVFTLRHISGKAKTLLEREMRRNNTGGVNDSINSGTIYSAFLLAVKKIEPLENDRGEQVELRFAAREGVQELSEESAALLPDDIINDVGLRAQINTYIDPK